MKYLTVIFLMIALLLSGCAAPLPDADATEPSEVTTAAPTQTLAPTTTPVPPKTLTVCTGALPDTLFPFTGAQSASKANILSIIQQAPIRLEEGEWVTEILESVPTRYNGDLRLEPALVQRGQTVVDANGLLTSVRQGVRVRPSGCRTNDCAIAWDGESPLEMDQMVVRFTIIDDLAWSDGTPVSAVDSVFSFTLARDLEAPGSAWIVDRTYAYDAVDAQTVRWTGRPGFSTAQLDQLIWAPLPSHLFTGSESPADLAANPQLSTDLLSYGPFALSRVDTDAVHFEVNPYFHRQDEGLPLLDEVTYQVVAGGRQAAWEALRDGKCDLLDSSFGFENDPQLLNEMNTNSQFEVHMQMGQSWEQLVFGIRPASYEDGYTPAFGDRQDVLADPLTRQGLAACLDRQAMLETIPGGEGSLWQSFLPPSQSQLQADTVLVFDMELGKALLTQAGWVDFDGNLETPLTAANVFNVTPGTPLSLELLTSQSPFHQALAQVVIQSFGACGAAVTHTALPTSEYYAPGPAGRLFGRDFDLALIAWQPSPDLDCSLYVSWQVPSAQNQWIGTNLTGIGNPGYDAACSAAALALPGESEDSVFQAESFFLTALPAVPLFAPPEVFLTPSVQCSDFDITSETGLFTQLALFDLCP